MTVKKGALWLVAVALAGLPAVASAQVTASIAGTVRDTSGAVLPGVTVEASSPALIEKTRSVVTDNQGNYKILDLRPGVYTVTATLSGFSVFRREGIELSAGFTANVPAELKVGSLEETITVTGATPLVDVQSTRTQNVLKAETMDQLPTGAKNLMSVAAMTLGAMPSSPGRNDVGGDKGEQATGIVLHGGRGDDGRTNWDGMNTNVFFGGAGGQQRTYYFNTVAMQEAVLDTGGSTAETETGGANLNIVPREGSNRLSLYGIANYTDENFSAKAVPSDLKTERGITDQSSLKKIYDYGVGLGGPFKQDKAWFYATHRSWGAQNFGAAVFEDSDTNLFTYTPDTSRQLFADTYFGDHSFRVTWQVSTKNKINHELHLQHGCSCDLGIGGGQLAARVASTDFNYGPQWLDQTTWSYTATNRLLIQAGATFLRQEVNFVGNVPKANKFTGAGKAEYPGPGVFSITELVGIPGGIPGGFTYNALSGGLFSYNWRETGNDSNNFNQKFTVSYVTGSHAFKTGVQTIQGHYDFTGMDPGVEQVNFQFRAGVPVSLTQFAGPFLSKTRLGALGIFAQDQWTMNRVTLNLGARYDQFRGRTPALDIPAGPFRAAYSVTEDPDLPNFKDITYRAGAAYDVFGNGKTAVKGSWGKYLMGQGGSLSQSGFAKAVGISTSGNRGWTDTNGNFLPDCNLANFSANGECLAVTNPLFGQPFVFQTLADDVKKGWGNREYSHQWNVQLQQELRPGLGLAIGYFHTQWANMSVTRNTRVTAADFSTYCITAPADTRLGATSGQQICGYYEVTPAGQAKGQAFELTQASNFGDPKDVFNGVDIGLNARWGKGALISGGVSIGRQVFDVCYANNRPDITPQNFPFSAFSTSRYPRNDQFCKIKPSWWDGNGSQAKVQVVYPLPYDVIVSGSYKHLPGIPVSANQVLTAAQVSAVLGRTSTAAGTATHGIIPVGSTAANSGGVSATVYDERLNQTDVRLAKILRFGSRRIQGNLDLYNVFNARTPQGIITTYGPVFLRPTSLLGGRLWKFGATIDW
jgi:hypothetical protein